MKPEKVHSRDKLTH